MRTSTALLGLLVAAAFHDGQAADDPRLRHNPFERPISLADTATSAAVPADDRPQGPDLRATLVSPSGGSANLAGRVMRPGDESNGYTLLKVFEDRAIFMHKGIRKTMFVKPAAADDDE